MFLMIPVYLFLFVGLTYLIGYITDDVTATVCGVVVVLGAVAGLHMLWHEREEQKKRIEGRMKTILKLLGLNGRFERIAQELASSSLTAAIRRAELNYAAAEIQYHSARMVTGYDSQNYVVTKCFFAVLLFERRRGYREKALPKFPTNPKLNSFNAWAIAIIREK